MTANEALQRLGLDSLESSNYILNEHFIKAIEMLNDVQLKAVVKTDGPVMVIAGPGTGKTQILSSRIGKILLESDISPQNILCLTYTDAGAKAIKERLAKFFGSKTTDVAVHTFHSFCSRIMAEYLMEGEVIDTQMITKLEKRRKIRQMLKAVPFGSELKRNINSIPNMVFALESFVSKIKQENYSVDEFEAKLLEDIELELLNPEYYYKRKTKDKNVGDLREDKWNKYLAKNAKSKQAIELYKTYAEWLISEKKMEFADLILQTIHLFETDENFRYRYQERFQYILIDEFQDTNGSQLKIAECLVEGIENPNIMIVGDDDQSIYRFQGAEVNNINYFYKKYLEGKSVQELQERILVLTENYRSAPQILAASESVITHNIHRVVNIVDAIPLSKKLIPKGREVKDLTQKVQIVSLPNAEQEYMYWALQVEKWQKAGYPMHEVAFLFYKNDAAFEFSQYLNALELPYNFTKAINILDSPFVLQIINLLEYASIESDQPFKGEGLLAHSFFYDFVKCSPYSVSKCMADYTKQNQHYHDQSERSHMPFREFLRGYTEDQSISQWFQITENLIKKSKTLPLLRFYDYLIDALDIRNYIQNSSLMLSHYQEWHSLRTFVVEQLMNDKKMTLAQLVALLREYQLEKVEIQLVKIYNSPNAVQLMTLHGSKGLEYDQVVIMKNIKTKKDNQNIYIPNALLYRDANNFESLVASINNEKYIEQEEQRRLFYVAMTRAKKELYISYPESKQTTNDNDKTNEVLQYVNEISEEHRDKRSESLSDEQLLRFAMVSQAACDKAEQQLYKGSYIEQLAQNYKMSVSSLNIFLKCPKEFYFTRFLTLPSQDQPHLLFGNAFHLALETFFKQARIANAFPTEQDLLDILMLLLSRDQYKFTPEEYEDRIAYAQKIVPIYYQKTQHEWIIDSDVEPNLEVTMNGYTLKGKIDKIEWLSPDTGRIIDFKTGSHKNAEEKLKAPSKQKVGEDEIAIGGDYWRQAVFYHILFELAYPNKTLDSIIYQFIFPNSEMQIKSHKVLVTQEDISIVKSQIEQTFSKVRALEFEGCGKAECEYCHTSSAKTPNYQ